MKDRKLYYIWSDMRARCTRETHHSFVNYGGRGITVCDRWDNSFDLFLKDMGARPTTKHTLDRINNDLGYSPDNCRWATRKEQNLNKRIYKNNKTGERNIETRGDVFRVRIRRDGKIVANAQFESIDEAKTFRDAFLR